jgi:hypothetical protein
MGHPAECAAAKRDAAEFKEQAQAGLKGLGWAWVEIELPTSQRRDVGHPDVGHPPRITQNDCPISQLTGDNRDYHLRKAMDARHCFQCEAKNPPDQSFCGQCGAALSLSDYISARVRRELADSIRDRNVVETESAINVFERALKWMKQAFGIFAGAVGLVVVVILGVSGWKASDFLKTVDSAKQSVVKSADATRQEIKKTSAQSVSDIQKASKKAIDANLASAANADRLSKNLNITASRTTAEFKGEATSLRTEVASSQSQLNEVKKLQPEFDSMRAQLAKATSDLAAQQKVISSSEEFVKQVFSTHVTYYFVFDNFIKPNHSIVIPAAPGVKNSVVYMLVPNTPIDGTLQLQYKVAVQPVGSYFHIHNLIIFFWGDPAENLKAEPLAVSFFPDKSDKDTIKSLYVRDGRVYADGQPFPKFGQPDPDWKGNKWIPFAQAATQPQKPDVKPQK